MEFSNYFPIWNKLTASQQALIQDSCVLRRATAGTILHNGSLDCLGLLLVQSGQLRAVMLSPEGREITIYRLFEQDICLFSASCVMRSIQFEITIEVEKDAELWIIPPDVYQTVMEESAAVANYTNEIMSSRFSEVMWLMEQVMWKSFDRRAGRVPGSGESAGGRPSAENHPRKNRQPPGNGPGSGDPDGCGISSGRAWCVCQGAA